MCLVWGRMACTEPQQAPPNPVVEGQMHFNLGLSHAQFRRFPEAIAAYDDEVGSLRAEGEGSEEEQPAPGPSTGRKLAW